MTTTKVEVIEETGRVTRTVETKVVKRFDLDWSELEERLAQGVGIWFAQEITITVAGDGCFDDRIRILGPPSSFPREREGNLKEIIGLLERHQEGKITSYELYEKLYNATERVYYVGGC